MNFRLILCGLGFHGELLLLYRSGNGIDDYQCKCCKTNIKIKNK
jgi:hypothetical protein